MNVSNRVPNELEIALGTKYAHTDARTAGTLQIARDVFIKVIARLVPLLP